MFLQELFQFGVTHALPLEAVTTSLFSSLPDLSVQRYNALLELLHLTGGIWLSDLNRNFKFDYMSKRMFDDSFKKMAIDLTISRGSIKEVAEELGINQSLLSKCRQQGSESQQIPAVLSEDQKMIKKLQKELKEAQLERDILKKAVGIFSKGDGRYSNL